MTTFDCWEVAVRPPEDYLMHYRTPGSKNGVRRYQTESGEWTPLGLRERREREGWGDGESRKLRKAEKKLARAEKKLAKSEKREEKQKIRAQKKFERSEEKRKKKLSGLTDEEMKQKLERARMEAEYRDLTKRTGLIESGAKLVGKYLEYKDNKEQRTLDLNRQKIEMERLKTQQLQAKEATKQAKEATNQSKNRIKTSKNEADKAESEAQQERYAAKGGKKYERKAQLVNAKTNYRGTTIFGSLGKRANNRAKYVQEKRMDKYNENASRRQLAAANVQLEREKEKTRQTMWGGGAKDNQNSNQGNDQSDKKKKKK